MNIEHLRVTANKVAQLIIFFVLGTSISVAEILYTYTGNPYNLLLHYDADANIYDETMHIDISFTTENYLTNFSGDATHLITSYRSSDGIHLITEETDGFDFELFLLETGSAGNIDQWMIRAKATTSNNVEANEIGYKSTSITSEYVIGGYEWDHVETRECIAVAFGSCSVSARYEARTYDSRGAWSISEVPSDLTANPNGPYTGIEGVAITFDGSASSVAHGTITAYAWDFGDGSTGAGANPEHVYVTTGIYIVTLTVTDNGGNSNTGTTTAHISNPQDLFPWEIFMPAILHGGKVNNATHQ